MFAEIIFPVLYIGDLETDPWRVRQFGAKRAVITTESPPTPANVDRYQDAGIVVNWAPCDPGEEISVAYIDELAGHGIPTLFQSATYRTAAALAICWCLRTQTRTSELAKVHGFDRDGELLRYSAQVVIKRLALYGVDIAITGPQKRTVEAYEKWVKANDRDTRQ